MDYTALAAELTAGHPVTGAYNADALTAAGQLNALNIELIKETMAGAEMWDQTDPVEFAGLTDIKQQKWLAFCAINSHNSENNGLAHQMVNYIFGGGSDTLTNLADARKYNISRAYQIRGAIEYIGDITESHVMTARGEI